MSVLLQSFRCVMSRVMVIKIGYEVKDIVVLRHVGAKVGMELCPQTAKVGGPVVCSSADT